jgi:hypothetical protein
MSAKKSPTIASAHQAGKALRDPRAPKVTKSAAAKVLGQTASKRKVKAAPKAGTAGRAATRRAVAKVVSSRKNK